MIEIVNVVKRTVNAIDASADTPTTPRIESVTGAIEVKQMKSVVIGAMPRDRLRPVSPGTIGLVAIMAIRTGDREEEPVAVVATMESAGTINYAVNTAILAALIVLARSS